MQDNFNLYNVQNALGYTFKDPTLIKKAFVYHSDKKTKNESNEGLIFLGKRLLEFILSDYVYCHYPYTDPRSLSDGLETYKNAVVLNRFIEENDLEGCIILNENAEALRSSKTVHHEIFLAIIAALYRDGGLPSLRAFLIPMLRDIDGEPKYAPKPQAKIETEDTVSKDGTKHITKESKKSPSKPETRASTIQKADTIETMDKNEKKSFKLTEKLFGKKTKDVPQKEEKTTSAEENGTAASEQTRSRSFIRDALTPVSLPEHMRNPRPKNAPKSEQKPKNELKTDVPAPAPIPESQDNAKSQLQEYVQKNLRTSSVLIKYVSEKNSDGSYRATVLINDKLLSSAEGSTKKFAEMNAASSALAGIKDNSSELGKWFSKQNVTTVSQINTEKDYVTKLNEHFQKENRTAAVPVVYEKLKVNEKRTKDPKGFVTSVKINGVELGVGKGFTPKEAKQNAAKAACEMLNIH